VFSGCTGAGNKIDDLIASITGEDIVLSAQESAWAGMDAYEDKDYKEALEHFQSLKDNYPFSKYAILAELKIGDCHYHLKQYSEAIFAYEEFEKLHPRNEAMPYVIYQVGLSYFEQIGTIDRDQSVTRNALDTFRRLQKQFPDDQYARSAEDHITVCIKNLVGHEYTIGVFYYKTKHYEAALHRFMRVLSKYPDVGYHQQSLEYIAKCEVEIAERED
jgi:outer membrane protein assembly factor BamD